MADKLSITIALEGGKAIEQQLASIGTAGQKAFQDISNAAQQAGGFKNLKPEEVTAKLKEMGVVGVDALNKITTAVQNATRLEQLVGVVQNVEQGFAGLASAAASFGRALGPIGIAAGAAFVAVEKAAVNAAGAINKVDAEAIKLGLSIEKFDNLRQGFEKMGISAQAAGSAIETLRKNLEALDVARVKQAADAAAAGAGIGSVAMKQLQAAAQGTGKAADDARLALSKLAEVQALKSLQADVESATQALQRAKAAAAAFASVPIGTPDQAQTMKALQAAVASAEIALQRAKAAVDGFKPDPAPLTGASAAFERLGIAAGDVSQRMPQVVAALAKLPDSAQRSADAILLLGQSAGTELIQFLRAGGTADDFAAKHGAMTQSVANDAARIEESTNRMSAAWERFKATGDLGQLDAAVGAFFTKLGAAIELSISQIGTLISKIAELAASWASKLFGGGPSGDTTPVPGNASGGLIGGRGTGTSDSNLSWVSRGEHIMPAAAVAQPGVLAFLEALRRSGGNLRGALDGIGRFAAGGLVAMPKLAAVGSGIGHLGTVDLRTDHGSVSLMASSSAMEQLSRLAVTKRMTSTGKKPGFIG